MWCVSQCVCNVTLNTRTLRDEGGVHCVSCVCAEGDKCDGCGLPTVTIKATCLFPPFLRLQLDTLDGNF